MPDKATAGPHPDHIIADTDQVETHILAELEVSPLRDLALDLLHDLVKARAEVRLAGRHDNAERIDRAYKELAAAVDALDGDTEVAAVELDLWCTVDGCQRERPCPVHDQLAEPAPEPKVTPGHPTKAGAGYDCMCGECRAQPALEPAGDGPGWRRAEIGYLAALFDRAKVTAGREPGEPGNQLRSLLADRDRLVALWAARCRDVYEAEQQRDAARAELAEVTAERDRLRAELREATHA